MVPSTQLFSYYTVVIRLHSRN